MCGLCLSYDITLRFQETAGAKQSVPSKHANDQQVAVRSLLPLKRRVQEVATSKVDPSSTTDGSFRRYDYCVVRHWFSNVVFADVGGSVH